VPSCKEPFARTGDCAICTANQNQWLIDILTILKDTSDRLEARRSERPLFAEQPNYLSVTARSKSDQKVSYTVAPFCKSTIQLAAQCHQRKYRHGFPALHLLALQRAWQRGTNLRRTTERSDRHYHRRN
jgi:hypothetical protein